MKTVYRILILVLVFVAGGTSLWLIQWWQSTELYDYLDSLIINPNEEPIVKGVEDMYRVKVDHLLPEDEWVKNFEIQYQILKVDSLRTYALIVIRRKCATPPFSLPLKGANFLIDGVTNEFGKHEFATLFLEPGDIAKLQAAQDSILYKVKDRGRLSLSIRRLFVKGELLLRSDDRSKYDEWYGEKKF
jgi:hypothetical protein